MYDAFIQELREICLERKINLKNIGSVRKTKKYPLFSIILNNISKPSKTICFSAGIHGDEIAGPLAIMKFLKNFNPNRFKDIKIIILPVVNPFGFDKQKYRGYLNKNINRHFSDKKLVGENNIIYNQIKNEDIFFFHALHEDIYESRFYLYCYEKKQEKFYRDVIRVAKKYFPINKDKRIYSNDSNKNGLIILDSHDGSLEDRLFREGVPYALTTESPWKQPLSKRIDLNVEIMNMVMKFSKT